MNADSEIRYCGACNKVGIGLSEIKTWAKLEYPMTIHRSADYSYFRTDTQSVLICDKCWPKFIGRYIESIKTTIKPTTTTPDK